MTTVGVMFSFSQVVDVVTVIELLWDQSYPATMSRCDEEQMEVSLHLLRVGALSLCFSLFSFRQ